MSSSGGRDKLDNYLLIRIGIIFLIFTLVKTKLPHYTLPAFPLMALLLARHWSGRAGTSLEKSGPDESAPNHVAVEKPAFSFQRIAGIAALLWLAIALLAPVVTARYFPAHVLFQKSRGYLRPEMEFGALEYNEPSLVWYFRSRVRGFMTPLNKRKAAAFMARVRSALRRRPESPDQHAIPGPAGGLEVVFDGRIQPGQRETGRFHACPETGIME